MLGGALTHDFVFFIGGGVADFDHEKKTIKLSFGEWIGAFLLDGILCGENEEGIGQGMIEAADGDLALLHGFEQSGLGLGRSAVDLISQDEVGEDRAGEELEDAL